jgi:hypothetical protein
MTLSTVRLCTEAIKVAASVGIIYREYMVSLSRDVSWEIVLSLCWIGNVLRIREVLFCQGDISLLNACTYERKIGLEVRGKPRKVCSA